MHMRLATYHYTVHAPHGHSFASIPLHVLTHVSHACTTTRFAFPAFSLCVTVMWFVSDCLP
jgi:hypothetical protein